MEEIKKLEEQIEYWEKIIEKKEEGWDWINPNLSFKEYVDFLKPESLILSHLHGKRRMIMSYTLSELPDYGDVMSLEEFVNHCKNGNLINYDGYGRYVKDGKETDIEIYPSDVKNNYVRTEFDTIIWFNR